MVDSTRCSPSTARNNSRRGGCEANEASIEAPKYLTVTVPEKGVEEKWVVHGVGKDLCQPAVVSDWILILMINIKCRANCKGETCLFKCSGI